MEDWGYEEAVNGLVSFVAETAANSSRVKRAGARRWTLGWLARPNAALGLHAPNEFMDTYGGRGMVAALLVQQLSPDGKHLGY